MADEASASGRSSGARSIALIVVGLLVVIAAFYALTDRYTPGSARGVVSAYVVEIAPRVSGTVTQVHVADDAIVEAGAPLFSLDARPFELAVARAEAELASALQSVDASSAGILAAQAAVAQARNALEETRIEADRTFRLVERGIAAEAKGEQARAAVADAEAALARTEADLERARRELGPEGENNPAVQAATAQLEQAQYDLTSTTVTARHLGAVTNVTLTEGQFIGAGRPAMTFIDSEAGWVTVDLRENQLQLVEAGDVAHVLFDALPGRIFTGRVQSIAWGIAPGRAARGGLVVNPTTTRWFEPARRIPVRVELDGGMENWPYAVRVGGAAHVVIFTAGANGPLAWIARAAQGVRSWLSFLY